MVEASAVVGALGWAEYLPLAKTLEDLLCSDLAIVSEKGRVAEYLEDIGGNLVVDWSG